MPQPSPPAKSATRPEPVRLEPAGLEPALLEVVTGLARELHPGQAAARPESSLERELGIDSLARVELLQRLERRLGLRFPPEAVAAERPADLLRLARRVAPGEVGLEPATPLAPTPLAGLPDEAQTIPEVLRWHAERHPERPCLHLLGDEGGAEPLRYAELLSGAERVAAGLRARGLGPGDAVAVMLPTGRDYFLALHGTLLAGAVPAPVYPPHRPSQLEEHVRRQVGILRNAEARLLIAPAGSGRLATLLRAHCPELRAVPSVAELAAEGAPGAPAPRLMGDAVALLQYTSGSTGAPKGVVLTHANLLANLRAMGRVIAIEATDVFVSWLPLYHDMGLIGACLGTLYHGCPLALMSPAAFLTRPSRWLRAIHRHGGTLSAAPDFAYGLCAARIPDEELDGLDLSSWRIAFNGAEPVHPDTLERFAARFAPYGLRPGALLPVYGLAESALGVTFPAPGRPPRIDRVRREAFARWRRAEPAAPDDPAPLRFVCCGRALPGHEVRVVGPDGRELGEREEGRLQARGPSVMRGYHRSAEATARALQDGWLETGDDAYVAEGEVYLTGRSKDLIIRAGRNLYPEELEAATGELEGVRKGCVVVFGSGAREDGVERLVVVAETRETDEDARARLAARVREVASDLLALPPDEVVLVPPGSVPKTSSGKLRRAACRELYEAGRLGQRRPLRGQLLRLALAGALPWLRRQARAAAALLYAAWVWTLVAVLAPPVWLLVQLLPGRGARQSLARSAIRLAFWLARVPVELRGRERLPAGPAVFVANHASYVDALLLFALLPRGVAFAAKEELGQSLLLARALRRLGHVFVERREAEGAQAGVEELAALAARGASLALFPEGTFDRSPGLRPFHLGAFVVATRARLPVVPVALRGTRALLRGDEWFPRRGPLRVEVEPSLAPEGEGWDEALRLRDAARAAILPACGEPDLGGEPLLPR
ncbi:MAG: AMP-binding protein [Planctomycetota bacterium]